MPAGAILGKSFVKGLTKYFRRGLLGEICDKLRIQGRMHIFGKSNVLVLNSEATEERRSYRCESPRILISWRFAPVAPPDSLSTSSYGWNKFRIDFLSQCHLCRGWTLVDIERTLYKVICIGNLAGRTRCSWNSLCGPFDKVRLG